MLRLRVKAPFAAFRTFTAGSYRPTAPFLTPSAAYGLVLNVAGIESRLDDGISPMTLMRSDLPVVELALGAVSLPGVHSLYQQLHNYPVGTTGKFRAPACKGAKYNIQPIRREFLSDLDAYVCLRGNDVLQRHVSESLRQEGRTMVDGKPRYGVPFLGDNSFMIDELREEVVAEKPAFWYLKLGPEDNSPALHRCRLTAWIDRANMVQTVAPLYALSEVATPDPPVQSWTQIIPGSLKS